MCIIRNVITKGVALYATIFTHMKIQFTEVTKTKLERFLPWLLIIGGVIGLLCSFVILFEKFQLLENPNYQVTCDINPIISCGSVMQSDQAEVFGFPNPIIGLVGFSVVITIGAALVAGARFRRWFWLGLLSGLALGVVFSHWLFFQTVYSIGALCPYCMVVWAVVIALFWYVLLYAMRMNIVRMPGRLLGFEAFFQRHHLDILIGWYVMITLLTLQHFWYYFGTFF